MTQANDSAIQLRGMKRLKRQLGHLPERAQRKVLRPSLRAGSRPIVRAARKNLKRNQSYRTGQLYKSLGIVQRTYRNVVFTAIGPRRGFKITTDQGNVDPANYGHIVEQRKPFMEPAFTSTGTQQMQAIESKVEQSIHKLKNRK